MRKTWFRSIYKFLTVFDFAVFFVDTIFAVQFYKGEQKVQFYAGVAQGLEHLPSEQRVVGLNPISCSSFHQQDDAQQKLSILNTIFMVIEYSEVARSK